MTAKLSSVTPLLDFPGTVASIPMTTDGEYKRGYVATTPSAPRDSTTPSGGGSSGSSRPRPERDCIVLSADSIPWMEPNVRDGHEHEDLAAVINGDHQLNRKSTRLNSSHPSI